MDQFLASVEKRAFRMAEMATRNRDDALDIVQDAMLTLVRNYRGHPADSWKPLFYRILQSRILDWHRRQSVRRRIFSWLGRQPDADDDTEEALQQLPDPAGFDFAQQLHQGRTLELLAEAVRDLPLRQQQAFLLRTWEGMDTAQSAAAMGCSVNSAKTHYARALGYLKGRLGEHLE